MLQSLILKLLKEPCPFSKPQRSWTSQLTYCISSCWPGKKSELITLLCSINLDNKLGTNTVWHNSVNQTKKQAPFVCKHLTFCKPKSFNGKKKCYKLIIEPTLDMRWTKTKQKQDKSKQFTQEKYSSGWKEMERKGQSSQRNNSN